MPALRKSNPVLEFPLLLVFPAAMAFAGAMDLLTMTIPNRVSLALLAAFAAAAPLTGMPWPQVFSHLLAGFATLALGILMFDRGWLGGGDAKLLSAAVLWLGFENVVQYVFLVAALGGVLAATILAYRCLVPPLWVATQPWAMRLHDRRTGIPYGLALAAAALWVYPSTSWFAVLAQ
jgi:prepilin peptidase CpaA